MDVVSSLTPTRFTSDAHSSFSRYSITPTKHLRNDKNGFPSNAKIIEQEQTSHVQQVLYRYRYSDKYIR